MTRDTDDDVRQTLLKELTVSVPFAGKALANLSRNSSYEAARRGEIEVIAIGKRKSVPTSWLRRKLGIEQEVA